MSTSQTVTYHQTVATILVTALFLASTGCKPTPPQGAGQATPELQGGASPRQPTTDDLARFFRSRMPAGPVKLADLKADPPVPLPNAAAGSNAWLYNVRVVLAPTEDMLGESTPQAAAAFQSTVDELSVLAAWSQAY